jgi:hypothetical protein
MKTPWVTLIAVLIGGLGVGAALAGRPTTPTHDIRISSVPATTTVASTTPALAPATALPASPATTTTAATGATTAPTTTTAATRVSTTTAASAAAITTTTTLVPDRITMLVLVANAGNASGIARAEAAHLAAIGYTKVITDNAVERLKETTAYARAGHEDEALLLLADAGLPADRLRPFPSQSVTTLDDNANVILALGLDWKA